WRELVAVAGRAAAGWRGPADAALAFQLDPTPMVLAARGLGVIADATAVAGVVLLGERLRRGAGGVAGLVVACAPAVILSSRAIVTDTIAASLSVWAME